MDTTLARSCSSRFDLSRRRLEGAALAFILACGLLTAARPAYAQPAETRPASVQGGYVRAATIGEVLSRWRPEVHLYVLGDVDLEEDALQALAAWLDGRHWTVLLVQDATGQTYTDVEGQVREGVDAIEYGTGQGIPKRPGFAEQVHPRTQEPDGAIFSIVLAQRVFFYTGSAAQDSRSLGDDHFQGNLDQWAIQAMRSSGDIVMAVRDTVTNIDTQVDLAIDRAAQEAVQARETAGQALTKGERDLADLERRERSGVAREELLAARQKLARARELYDRGTPGYDQPLSEAREGLFVAELAISRADGRAAFGRALKIFFLTFLVSALLGTGFVLNRRRRGVRREAERLLAAWRTALDAKLGALLDELERRVARFVGPASGEGRRPWAGETLRWAEQIRADVGSLYILWTSANGVLQQAEALIRASGLGAVYNFFLPGKYRRGIALLKDEPVPFDPAGGLPKLFGGEHTWRDDLLGDLAGYEPFHKSFQDLVGELDLRAKRATEALALVEASSLQGPSLLEETGARISETAALREEIERAGSAEGLFLVPAVCAMALPAASDALARTRALFPTDPVGALRVDGARARRIAMESWQLAGLVAAARHGVLPAVEAGAVALRDVSIATAWIEAERIQLSGHADLLAEQAAEEPVSAGIEELAVSLADLGLRVERAVTLSRVLEEEARPEAQRVAGLVQAARADLGGFEPAAGPHPAGRGLRSL